MGFYGSNDPTDSVKALKEVVVLRIGLNPTRSTSPCCNTTHACNIQSYRKYIHIYTKMNLRQWKWAQWDKTQSRDLLDLLICVCIALCTIVAHNIAQNRRDNFPSYPLLPSSSNWYWSQSSAVNRHNILTTNATSVVSQHQLVSGWRLQKWRSVPAYGPVWLRKDLMSLFPRDTARKLPIPGDDTLRVTPTELF